MRGTDILKIVAGRLKARQLTLPKKSDIRPTTDKLRSAIFSILSDKILNAAVIDIFAGSGALGIEAISRGAASVTFIDKDIESVKLNIKLIEDSDYLLIRKNFLKLEGVENKSYDIIFIDPPYGKYKSEDILQVVADKLIMNNDAIIIYEEFYKTIFTATDNFDIVDERKFGDTVIRFLKKQNAR